MRIGSIIVAAAASALLGATAATAADLPMEPAPAAVAISGFTWDGVYVGGAVGYAFSDLRTRNGGLGDPLSYRDNVDSWLGSLYVGANYQFDQIVAGVEADITYADFGGKNRGCGRFTCRSNADDWFGTIRGRVGYAFDRTLVFATGGLAIGEDVDFKRTGNGLPAAFDFAKDDSGMRYGYVLGGGVDYAATDNLILRAEYQYVDFGKESLRAVNALGGGQPAKIDQDAHIVRVGVAYKF